jgi:hypothetical protein
MGLQELVAIVIGLKFVCHIPRESVCGALDTDGSFHSLRRPPLDLDSILPSQ